MKLGLGRSALTDDSAIAGENRGRPSLGEVIEEISKDNGVTEEKGRWFALRVWKKIQIPEEKEVRFEDRVPVLERAEEDDDALCR
jgi:hypothetical protein